jgi:hypothetical protein
MVSIKKAAWLPLLAAGFFACKPTENTAVNGSGQAPQDTAVAAADSAAGPEKFRLIVSFISIGMGTDRKAAEVFQGYLNEYREKTHKKIERIAAPWGREGEVDYCFRLDELSPAEQAEFISGLRDRLSFSELVQFAENEICSNLPD